MAETFKIEELEEKVILVGVSEQEGDDVGQDDGDDGIDECAAKRLPVSGVGDGCLIVGETDERLLCRNAIPAGECEVEAIEER